MSAAPPPASERPWLRLVLAVSLDGRLAPAEGGAAQIGGRGDRRVLEEALAWADGALLGAETLRCHGCTCLIHAPDLLEQRRRRGRPDQPVSLVVSRSGRFPPDLPFFRQPLQRWLLLAQDFSRPEASAALPAWPAPSPASASARGQGADPQPGFGRVIGMAAWEQALQQLAAAGVKRLVVLGGASVATTLLAENRIDELQLTLCPRLLGGEHTWLGSTARLPGAACSGWRLLEQRPLEGDELLLRYSREPDAG